MEMKLVNYKNFRKWCDKAPKVNARIDLMSLDNNQKDSAVAALCIDYGTAEMLTIAMNVSLKSTSSDYKNDAYQGFEIEMLELVQQYHDTIDYEAAKALDEYRERDKYNFDKSFNHVFNIDQSMYDAGHKHSDF
jgi:hypothetical protein